MAHQVEVTSETTRKASVEIPRSDYEAGVNRALRKLSNRVKLRGFRKGKIPLNVMKQHYGQAVQSDVLDELLNKSIQTVMEDLKEVIYVDQPNIQSLPIGGNDDFKFTVELEVRPNIDPIGYKGIEVERPAITIGDEEVNLELMAIRRQQGVSTPIEGRDTIQEGDLVTFDFKALADDEELQDFQGENAEVRIGDSVAMPGIEEALTGAKFDATVVANVKTDDKFRVESLRNKTFDVEITVKKVVAQTLHDLNDELAKKVKMGETVDELKANIRERLEDRLAHDARHHAEEDLLDKLLEQNAFDLPPRFLDQDLMQTVKRQLQQFQNMDEQILNQLAMSMKETVRYERERALKSDFLIHAIADKEEIKVENEDLQKTIEHQAMHMNATPTQLMNFLRQNQDALRQMMSTARVEKTVTWLVENATIVDISWEKAERKRDAREKAKQEAQQAAMPDLSAMQQQAETTEVAEVAAEAPAEAPKAKKAKAKGYDADAANEAFAAMTVSDLKDLCKANDLKVSGKKDELIERLIEAEVNP